MARCYNEDEDEEFYEYEPLPTVLEDEENVSLADILSLLDSCLTETEVLAVCLECCLALRSIGHAELFRNLCITPDTLAFNTHGNVCFMEQLSDDPEGAFIPPEFDETGNTFKAHIYSLGMTLLAAVEYVVEPELSMEMSAELRALLEKMQHDDPDSRPDIETVLRLCQSRLQSESSASVCRHLSATGRRVLSIESINTASDSGGDSWRLTFNERNPADGSSSTEDLSFDRMVHNAAPAKAKADKDDRGSLQDPSTKPQGETGPQKKKEDGKPECSKRHCKELLGLFDLVPLSEGAQPHVEAAGATVCSPLKRRLLPKIPVEAFPKMQQQQQSLVHASALDGKENFAVDFCARGTKSSRAAVPDELTMKPAARHLFKVHSLDEQVSESFRSVADSDKASGSAADGQGATRTSGTATRIVKRCRSLDSPYDGERADRLTRSSPVRQRNLRVGGQLTYWPTLVDKRRLEDSDPTLRAGKGDDRIGSGSAARNADAVSSSQLQRRRESIEEVSLGAVLAGWGKPLGEQLLWCVCREAALTLQGNKQLPVYVSVDTLLIQTQGTATFCPPPGNVQAFYLAPELQDNGLLSEKSCVYGLAATLWSAAKCNLAACQKLKLSGPFKQLLLSMAKNQPQDRPSLAHIIKASSDYQDKRGISSRETCAFLRSRTLQTQKQCAAEAQKSLQPQMPTQSVSECTKHTADTNTKKPATENMQLITKTSPTKSGFVPISAEARLTAVKGPVPNEGSPGKLPTAFTSTATHFKPIVLRRETTRSPEGCVAKISGDKQAIKTVNKEVTQRQSGIATGEAEDGTGNSLGSVAADCRGDTLSATVSPDSGSPDSTKQSADASSGNKKMLRSDSSDSATDSSSPNSNASFSLDQILAAGTQVPNFMLQQDPITGLFTLVPVILPSQTQSHLAHSVPSVLFKWPAQIDVKSSNQAAVAISGRTQAERKPDSLFCAPLELTAAPHVISRGVSNSSSQGTPTSVDSEGLSLPSSALSSPASLQKASPWCSAPEADISGPLRRVNLLIREEFAFDGYMENGVEDLAVAEYIMSLKGLKFPTFCSAVSEKFSDLYWDETLLENLYEAVSGQPPPTPDSSDSHDDVQLSAPLSATSSEDGDALDEDEADGDDSRDDENVIRGMVERETFPSRYVPSSVSYQPVRSKDASHTMMEHSQLSEPEGKSNHALAQVTPVRKPTDAQAGNPTASPRVTPQTERKTGPPRDLHKAGASTDREQHDRAGGNALSQSVRSERSRVPPRRAISRRLKSAPSMAGSVASEGATQSRAAMAAGGAGTLGGLAQMRGCPEGSQQLKKPLLAWESLRYGAGFFSNEVKDCVHQQRARRSSDINLESKLQEVDQQIMLEGKNLRKSRALIHKLSQQGQASKETKGVLSKLKEQVKEMREKIEFLQTTKRYIELLFADEWGLEISLLRAFLGWRAPAPLCLQPAPPSPELVFQPAHAGQAASRPTLQAGTPHALMCYLYSSFAAVDGFIHHFLYTFRYFCVPSHLLQFLLERLEATCSGAVNQPREVVSIRIRSLDILSLWVGDCYNIDFKPNPEMRQLLKTFIQKKLWVEEQRAERLLALLRSHESGESPSRVVGPLAPITEPVGVEEGPLFIKSDRIPVQPMEDASKKSSPLKRLPLGRRAGRPDGGSPSIGTRERGLERERAIAKERDKGKGWKSLAGPADPWLYIPTCRVVAADKTLFSHREVTALRLAQQLSLMQQELFLQCHPVDFMNTRALGLKETGPLRPTAEPASTDPPSLFVPECANDHPITRLIEHSDTVSTWISAEIVTCDGAKSQLAVLSKLLWVAKHCCDIRNFSTGMQILQGMENIIVRQLPVWKHVPPKVANIMNQLNDVKMFLKRDGMCLMEEGGHVKNPTIPCARIFAMHVQQLEIGAFTMASGLYKWSKIRSISETVSGIRILQESPYPFRHEYELQAWLRERIVYFGLADIQALASENSTNFQPLHGDRGIHKIKEAFLRITT
uniref:Kinase non-catalytic C-lobe domain-containing protein 1-like n=1 Tax=Petromyzon marinus TaxID=7757 RepID=A0AAJ7SYE9_PETMA|nr:kinase non-catalytic C-lobe domain-containing protein 1-like [Petromyzon marinus]